MANVVYAAGAFTGGTDGCLDYPDGNSLNDGDIGIVTTSTGYMSFFRLIAASGATAIPGKIIAPTTNPGNKRWVLQEDPFPTLRKNFLINGTMQVAQRGNVAASGSWQYGGCDRWLSTLGGTGVSGTIQQATGPSRTGYLHGISNVSFTSGYFGFAYRMEAQDSIWLNGKTCTWSTRVYHDTGSNRNFNLAVYKANSADVFSALTLVTTCTAISVPSEAYTDIYYTFTLGSTDASNGLQFQFWNSTSFTASSKNCWIGDVQLEIGGIPTSLEFRHMQQEFALCHRYYEIGVESGHVAGLYATGYVQNNWVGFLARKRATPTMALAAITLTNLGSSPTLYNAYPRINGFSPVFSVTGGSVGAAGQSYFSWTADAELY